MIKFAITNIHKSIDMIPKNEYAPFQLFYIKNVINNKSIIENLIASQEKFDTLLRSLPTEKHEFSYEKGKWTLKDLIQHCIDSERIFNYRALCFARNDKTSLPGFDQDLFVNNVNANSRNYFELLDELDLVRKSTILLYRSFSDGAYLRIGNCSGYTISVRALGYLTSGHQIHHLNVVKERYL